MRIRQECISHISGVNGIESEVSKEYLAQSYPPETQWIYVCLINIRTIELVINKRIILCYEGDYTVRQNVGW